MSLYRAYFLVSLSYFISLARIGYHESKANITARQITSYQKIKIKESIIVEKLNEISNYLKVYSKPEAQAIRPIIRNFGISVKTEIINLKNAT